MIFYYWVSNIFRNGAIVSIFRNSKISYNAREERVKRLSKKTVFRNDFIIFYQCGLFFRNYVVCKKRFYCFPKKFVVAYVFFVKISIAFFFRFAPK